MNWRIYAAVPLALLATGCFDPDGDGLSNGEERELGLNPEAADTDGDGLSDGDEVALGTDGLNADTDGDGLLDGLEIENGADPSVADTDGDGYSDRDEVHEGTDPADDTSVIYKGGWPYYFAKDELSRQNGGDFAEVGKRFRRYQYKDQFGDTVDLFDFYNEEGKQVVVDVSAEWCPPCRALAEWLDHQDDQMGLSPEFDALRDAVDNGDIYWITMLSENDDGEAAAKRDATEWYNEYPSPNIPVMADNTRDVPGYTELPFWPSTFLLTPDLKVDTLTTSDWQVPLTEAMNNL